MERLLPSPNPSLILEHPGTSFSYVKAATDDQFLLTTAFLLTIAAQVSSLRQQISTIKMDAQVRPLKLSTIKLAPSSGSAELNTQAFVDGPCHSYLSANPPPTSNVLMQ